MTFKNAVPASKKSREHKARGSFYLRSSVFSDDFLRFLESMDVFNNDEEHRNNEDLENGSGKHTEYNGNPHFRAGICTRTGRKSQWDVTNDESKDVIRIGRRRIFDASTAA